VSQPTNSKPNPSTPSYRERPLRGQEAFAYGFKQRAKTHHCLAYATFSVDTSRLEEARKAYCRTISPITNLAVFVKAVGVTLARHPGANAILFKRWYGYRIVQFNRVDVNVPITRRISGSDLTFIGTVRAAAEKTIAEIQAELSALQRDPPESLPAVQRLLWFANKPLWLARLIHAWMARSPAFYLRNVGTCGLTLGGEEGQEHFFPIAPTSVVFGIGSLRSEPVVRDGQISAARILRCSLMIDNYVVAGLLGGALLKEFKALLESGHILTDELARPA
jgi:pyruvate/2-oxoglutarate dehydrogenase complex dihydrolipoamide acyltransferase (E2) component